MADPAPLLPEPERRKKELLARAGYDGVRHLAQTLQARDPKLPASESNVSRILSGQSRQMDVRMPQAIAEALGISVGEFWATFYGGPPPASKGRYLKPRRQTVAA